MSTVDIAVPGSVVATHPQRECRLEVIGIDATACLWIIHGRLKRWLVLNGFQLNNDGYAMPAGLKINLVCLIFWERHFSHFGSCRLFSIRP